MRKKCIIIGSNASVDGKRYGKDIDSGRYGKVIRLNRAYGNPQDVGEHTDEIWTRHKSWIGDITPYIQGMRYVVVNEFLGISPAALEQCKQEVGVEHVSIGTLAVWWYLSRGYQVYYAGCGYDTWYRKLGKKRYSKVNKQVADNLTKHHDVLVKTNMVDNNPVYDWTRENQWLERNRKKLILL